MIRNSSKMALLFMVPTVVMSSSVAANAMGGIRSFGNSVVTVAVRLLQASSKTGVKGILGKSKPEDGIDHNLVSQSINLFNENKPVFLKHLIEDPRQLPLKEALEVTKTPKIKLQGYYYVEGENTFYPIIKEDNSLGPAHKVPKGIVTLNGFKGKNSKDDGIYEVIKVQSRSEVSVKNLEGSDEKHEHVSSIFSENFKNISDRKSIVDHDENEKALVNLAIKYSRDKFKIDIDNPDDFITRDNSTYKNAFTVFSASFANDNDPEFNEWLGKNYKNVNPKVKENLKLIGQKLTSVKSKSDVSLSSKLESISIKDSSSEGVGGASASVLQLDEESKKQYETQGARPKLKDKKSK